jgi:hypothetical protein
VTHFRYCKKKTLYPVVPDGKTGSCLDPELLGTGLQERGEKRPGPPSSGRNSQLEPGRDGETVRRDREKPITDMMEEDQWPTE